MVFDSPHLSLQALKIALRFGAMSKKTSKAVDADGKTVKSHKTLLNCPHF